MIIQNGKPVLIPAPAGTVTNSLATQQQPQVTAIVPQAQQQQAQLPPGKIVLTQKGQVRSTVEYKIYEYIEIEAAEVLWIVNILFCSSVVTINSKLSKVYCEIGWFLLVFI